MMSKVFAFHDLAGVLSAFPPAHPTAQAPSLILSKNGQRLLQSTSLQDRLAKLVNESETRIPVATLPTVLETNHIDWLLHDLTDPILYDADQKAIVCVPETKRLITELHNATQDQFLYLNAFAAEHDLDSRSLRQLLEADKAVHVVQDPFSKSGRTWLFSDKLDSSTREEIETLMRGAGSEHKVDISAKLPGAPKFLVQRLAEQISQEKSIPGTIRQGKTRITFLSEAYETRINEERAKRVARQFSKILVHTHRFGFHRVPEDTEEAPGLQQVFFERTKAGLDDGSFSMINADDKPIAIAFTNRLETVLDELKASASTHLNDSWRTTSDTTTLDQTRIQTLVDGCSSSDFALLILADPKYRSAIEESMKSKASELTSEDSERLNAAFNECVRVPIRLYLIGINNVQDASLRQRLEDFVLEFLRKDMIPNAVQLLLYDKQRERPFGKEMERFSQACVDAKALTDIQTALSKFARKQKLPSVTDAEEKEAKSYIMLQKAKSLKKMIRASDILQNLIWILLATKLNGIFISSGRDTTRMIRFYQGIGDADKGARLEAWKDKFKLGLETREDIEGMRTLAEEVLGGSTNGLAASPTPA